MNRLQQRSTWWGDYLFTDDSPRQIQIGPLLLNIRRSSQEWQVSHAADNFDETAQNSWAVSIPEESTGESKELHRHVFTKTDPHLQLVPLTADRSVVVKSAAPIHIQVGQDVYFYVSTPLWIRAQVHNEKMALFDMPVSRPSDTWFGISTMQGEFCYATTTQGRLDFSDLPIRPHRAITPVLIKNRSHKPLLLQKLNLPVPYLSLFDIGENGLWTEEVTIIHEDDTEFSRVMVGEKPPSSFADPVAVNTARLSRERNIFTRAFSVLFT